jgi:UDP-glucose 4-epimerase
MPRLVSSTCAVYGQPDEVPIRESAPPRPANAYGASKLAVDQMITSYSIGHGSALSASVSSTSPARAVEPAKTTIPKPT